MTPCYPLALAALLALSCAQAAEPPPPSPREVCVALLSGALVASGVEQLCQLPQRTLSSQLQQGFSLLGCTRQVSEQEGVQLSKRIAEQINQQARQQDRQTFCAQKQQAYQTSLREFTPLLDKARQEAGR
jgi:hypothetical protein